MTIAFPKFRRRGALHPREALRRPTFWFAVLSFVGPFLSSPGQVAADTKQFLYLDPIRMLGRVTSMWDPNAGLGTVTHQNIGYLFPLGPFFALCKILHIPMWVGQRLWYGMLFFAALAGAQWMLKLMGFTNQRAIVAGALIYGLSPYTLAYFGRTSALLFPWAALPSLIALTITSLRTASHIRHPMRSLTAWRPPVMFALVITLVGGTNASSLFFILLGPLSWVVYSTAVEHEQSWRRAAGAMFRIGIATLPLQLWWLMGLRTQGAYGLPVLKLTETIETVAETSTPSEVVRQLGYWYFYGRDGVGPWTEAAKYYTQKIWLILVSFAVPAFAFLSAAIARFRHRIFFVGIMFGGMVIAIGTHPNQSAPPVGRLLKAFGESSVLGLGLRNSPRAVPLVSLGLAGLIAGGLEALAMHEGRTAKFRFLPTFDIAKLSRNISLLVVVVAVANFPQLWTGNLVPANLQRSETLPAFWTQATAALNNGDTRRVLELPGVDFGTYRWGNTQDLITQGLMDRPWVGRELIPFGEAASSDLLRALDHRLQEGTLDANAVAPVARLIGASQVLLRSDTQYERFRTPRPRLVWDQFSPAPAGLSTPVTYGPTIRNTAIPGQPLLDEQQLNIPPTAADPPPVAVFDVFNSPAVVRAVAANRPILMAGDGEGIVDVADLLDPALPLIEAAALSAEALAKTVKPGSTVIITDTNRRRGQRWGTERENFGYTEQVDETPVVKDPKDARLEVFPKATGDSYTVSELRGAAQIRASHYGNPVSFTAEDRPSNAFDGDVRTAWKVGAFDEVRGEYLRIDLPAAITAERIGLTQARGGNRWITNATIKFLYRNEVRASQAIALGDLSRTDGGESFAFPSTTFDGIEIHIDNVNIKRLPYYAGFSPVGLAEVTIPTVKVNELVRLPKDLLNAPGALDDANTVIINMARLRANPQEPFRADPEPALARTFTLPRALIGTISGSAQIDARSADTMLDSLLNAPGTVVATSSDRLAGLRSARASAAIDNDPTTFWNPGFGNQIGRWIDLTVPSNSPSIVADELNLSIVNDGRHSVPTQLGVAVDGKDIGTVDIPSQPDSTVENHTVSVTVKSPHIDGHAVRFTITQYRRIDTIDFYSLGRIDMPVGIAELGIATLPVAKPATALDTACRTDLLTIDDKPMGIQLAQTTIADAKTGAQIPFSACSTETFTLTAGEHIIRSANGADIGISIDQLRFTHLPKKPLAASTVAAPQITVTHQGRTSITASAAITKATSPSQYWLVLGQSQNAGWEASVNGHSIGTSQLINGYANGWLITPGSVGSTDVIVLTWTPQRAVDLALLISGIGLALAIIFIGISWRRRRRIAELSANPSDFGAHIMAPWRMVPQRIELGTLGTLATTLGICAALLNGLTCGIIVFVLVGLSLWLRRMRFVTSMSAWIIMANVGVYTAGRQFGYKYKPGVEWPTAFDPVSWFVYLGVMLLVADVIVERRRHPILSIDKDPE